MTLRERTKSFIWGSFYFMGVCWAGVLLVVIGLYIGGMAEPHLDPSPARAGCAHDCTVHPEHMTCRLSGPMRENMGQTIIECDGLRPIPLPWEADFEGCWWGEATYRRRADWLSAGYAGRPVELITLGARCPSGYRWLYRRPGVPAEEVFDHGM